MPPQVIITAGTVADCTQAAALMEGGRKNLIADKGYDSDAIVVHAQSKGMSAVIPPRSNRKEQQNYDKYLHKLRHLVENTFLRLNQWRGIATRYAKRISSSFAPVQLRCASIWTEISFLRTIFSFLSK